MTPAARWRSSRQLYQYLWFDELNDPRLEGLIAVGPLAALDEIARRGHRNATPPVAVMFETDGVWHDKSGKVMGRDETNKQEAA